LLCLDRNPGNGIAFLENTTLVGSFQNFEDINDQKIWGWENFFTRCDDYIEPEQVTWINSYPNPFNTQVQLVFEVNTPFAIPVYIKIYDVLGQEVASLQNPTQFGPGVHEITWNASNLASGFYFARFESRDLARNGFVSSDETIKLLLVK